MVNRSLMLLLASTRSLSICSPNHHTFAFVHDGVEMAKLGPNDAKRRYETPSDLSVYDFVRRAMAEAQMAILEIDKAQAEVDAPKLA
jgi:hypothetical protein